MDRIVTAAAKSKGIAPQSIICEDLGTLTSPVKAVMEKRGYSGIRVTQFVDPNEPTHIYRGRNVALRHWMTTGTHDNEPILLWSKKRLEKNSAELWKHAENLAEDLIPEPARREAYKQSLTHDACALTQAKFAELFAGPSEQVQIFFTDLFGMETPYNRPSTVGNENWVLRIPQDFAAAYFAAVKAGGALNLPAAFATALRARGGDQHAALIAELDQYAGLLLSGVVIGQEVSESRN